MARNLIEGKRVAVVGSGPGVEDNARGVVDDHDVVVRANNYKLSDGAGRRTDIYYSFFGNSIRKEKEELKRDGVALCWARCPNEYVLYTDWHAARHAETAVSWKWIYNLRRNWWPCPVFVNTVQEFLPAFCLLGGHMPTTGFSMILDVLSFKPAKLYVTGFDFFTSDLHNVNERWGRQNKNLDDPIRHRPEREAQLFANFFAVSKTSPDNDTKIAVDRRLERVLMSVTPREHWADEFNLRVTKP